MTDPEPSPTILARMLRAGISEDRAREHLARGVVLLDGEVITAPDGPASGRWQIGAA